MIEKQIKITSYDVQPNSVVKLSSMQKYMQQIAREDLLEYDIDYYEMRDDYKQVFVLVKMAFEFYAPIYSEQLLTARTWQKEIRGATYVREFDFYRDGKCVAACSSHWVLIDFDKRSILRPDQLYKKGRSFPEVSTGIEVKKRIITSDDDLEFVGTHKVMYGDLDENLHLNNTVYPDIVMNYSPVFIDGFHPMVKHVQINYATEAKLGDSLSVYTAKCENGYKTRIKNDKTNKTCVDMVASFMNDD